MIEHEPLQTNTILVSESLSPYQSFLRAGVISAAEMPALAKPHIRWKVVEQGGAVGPYIGHDVPRSGWDGFLVGFSADRQQAILERLGQEMLLGISHIGKSEGVPPDRLLAALQEDRLTPRLAFMLEPVMVGALASMRTTGAEGMDMSGYSHWRTSYEMSLAALEQELENAGSHEARNDAARKIFEKQNELRTELHQVTNGRMAAAATYFQVHEDVVRSVDSVATTTKPISIDAINGTIQYTLPNIAGLQSNQSPVSAELLEWQIPLIQIPRLIGNPITRANLSMR